MENKKQKLYIITTHASGYVANTLKEVKETIKYLTNPTIREYTLINGKWERTYEDNFGIPNTEDLWE